jgi:pilus assembly protein TadC
MREFLGVVGILLVLFGVTVLIVGGVRHFFPFVEGYIPEEFKKPLSLGMAGYYVLGGLLLMLLL